MIIDIDQSCLMSPLPGLVIPGYPHYVTQQGNRRAQIWAYCLMPNHVHLIVVPEDEDGLHRTFADAHRRYSGYINARLRVTGYLWPGRFGSVVMDEEYLLNTDYYISLNPVRAPLVEKAQQ